MFADTNRLYGMALNEKLLSEMVVMVRFRFKVRFKVMLRVRVS